KPLVIERWPSESEVKHKVPTALTYRAGNIHACSWGFGCPGSGQAEQGMGVKDLFKFYLDKKVLEDSYPNRHGAPGTVEDVQNWFTDFLTFLHEHIVDYLGKKPWGVNWGATEVEFIFSLPTLWKGNEELIQVFGAIIKKA